MRAIAICAVLAGCGQPEATPVARGPVTAGSAARDVTAPGAPAGPATPPPPAFRLPDGVAPVSYDLTLALDADRDAFSGHAAIQIAVTAPGTVQLWLHAVDLEIENARIVTGGRYEPVAVLAGRPSSQMRGFALPRPIGSPAGETITLVLDYTGRAPELAGRHKDEEGLFRERTGGRWYLYSQSESIFARRIVPCFDEPRFKPAWRVTAMVPRQQVALANAPLVGDRVLPDGRRELRFAEIAQMPSYLLAIAVGPFDVVDAGRLGRGHLPVRIAVAKGEGARAGLAIRTLPKIIDALESYLDAPLPSAKLDLVAVPQFFGAMENTGLITFEAGVLVGGRNLVSVAAHELAHQWFGNLVTPAWWDDLWLSEAFATWLGERVTESLAATPLPVVAHGVRALALAADERIDARPLIHPIASSDDIEPAFDAIAYDKGAALLAMFERFVGLPAFQAALRGFLAAHAGTSVTSQALLDALAATTTPEVGAALGSNLGHAGTPIVDLALRCSDTATLAASARDRVTVPVCVRFPGAAGASERACFLAGGSTEHALPAAAGCPAWLVGNAGGRGYYHVAWLGAPPHPPLALLSPEERLAQGDDAAAAVRRGDLPTADALTELSALAATRDAYGQLAALSIARAINPLVADPVRPAWATWLAKRFPDRMTRTALITPRSLVAEVLRDQLVPLTRAALDPATFAAIRGEVDRAADGDYDAVRLGLAAAHHSEPLFERIVRAAAAARSDAWRDDRLADLGEFPAAFAPRVVDLLLDRRFKAAQVSPALVAMLRRGDASTAWAAIHARFASVFAALPAVRRRNLIEAMAALCDATARAEVVADVTPELAAIGDGQRVLDQTLATIDRCIARRAAVGDIAAALAASPVPGAATSAPARRPMTPRP